ncbi:Uncharacterised protein [Chlamydia trachomatis]|nr:Uncharacterised protein [Chlamydia trachomatis]
MMEKEKETKGLESVEDKGLEQQGEAQEMKDEVVEKPDLFRKISDAIPQRHVKKVLWVLLALILIGLGLQTYNAFWGNPRERAERKRVEEENALLYKQLEEQRANDDVRLLEDGSVVSSDLLEDLDSTTSSDELFDAYSNTIELDGEELN